MKITALYVYPIKALRGIPLTSARLTAQGIQHDRRFMLFEVKDDGTLKKIQLDRVSECALFEQEFEFGPDNPREPVAVAIRYLKPSVPRAPLHALQDVPLTVPLAPDMTKLEPVDVDLHGSPASAAYRMGRDCNAWFSACFGRDVVLVYLGDGYREVLGETLLPSTHNTASQGRQQPAQAWPGWIASVSAMVVARSPPEPQPPPARPRIAFSDVAPFLVVTETSARDVSGRLPDGVEMDVRKYRPSIVLDGKDEEAFAEDFWGEVEIGGSTRLVLTANCARCTSLNVDYTTGRPAEGELGNVLKKLMRDRRVDKGSKWSPIFGRYAFLADAEKEVSVSIGDDVRVTRRLEERTTWDWDIP